MSEETTPEQSSVGAPPNDRSLCFSSEGWKAFRSKSCEAKLDVVLTNLEYFGFFIIVAMVIIGAGNIVTHEIYIIFSQIKLSDEDYDTLSESRQQYIGAIFFVLILVEVISLVKASMKTEKLTPTFPILIGMTSLVREIIKPKDAATPDSLFMLTLGIVALSIAIWIIGASPIDKETEPPSQSNPKESSRVTKGSSAR